MERIRLEGQSGKHIEVRSCSVGEFPRVYELAVKFLEAIDEKGMLAIGQEILDTFAPTLNLEELTMEDLWAILMAKAGRAKREMLEKLPDLAASAMVDFFGQVGIERALEMSGAISSESGDDT